MFTAFLGELGFEKYDLALLIFCPAGAVIGSLAQAILLSINPNKPPRDASKTYRAPSHLAEARGAWLLLRLTLGLILGIVISLYFVGTLQQSHIALAKITALSILLGYAAPKIWISQEKLLIERISEIVNEKHAISFESEAKNVLPKSD